ncbi:glycosyltransferase [Clostridium sp. AWRP]|uniref:glycosyltransferase n=1 Tax=Clostridium sp. AWRP TaxID=2212991 RepID=UPI000FD92D7E|nr:glycosyltransferase [Clostridium sp. AWRP]AZV57595.1 glycosyltransferase [Clostridium sp. AWRP]
MITFEEKDCTPLFIMTDDTGMIQHSVFSVPDPNSGYTTDDNARALITAVMLYEKFKSEKYIKLIFTYTSFLLYAQNKRGTFKNFMDYNRNFIEEEGSEDCFGRCLWSLGYMFQSKTIPSSIKHAAENMISKALPNVKSLSYIHSKAYCLLGLNFIYSELLETSSTFKISKHTVKEDITMLSDSLVENFKCYSSDSWKWFENNLTYANGIFPWCLLKSSNTLNSKEYLNIALEALNFLEQHCFRKGYFKPIGNNTWFKKGDSHPSEFDEQPLEACGTALMYMEAYKLLKDAKYLDKAKLCYEWFLGKNSAKKSLVDSFTRGGMDGIMENEVNSNQGAESIIAKILTELLLSKYIDF